jgi:hypothetical protein
MKMNFDDQTEGSLRSILDAVVKSDTEAFDTAVRSLKQEDRAADVLELAVAVLSYAIFDTYEGKPTAADVELIAQTVTEMEGWVNLDPVEVREYLTGVLAGKPLSEILDPQSAFFLTFIIAGSVLAASPKISEGEWWFNYLDRVEAAIEAAASGK